VLDTQVPVTKEQYLQTPMGMAALPVYKWKYYNIHKLIHLGLSTSNEDIVAGTANIDIAGNEDYVRESDQEMVLNWFEPSMCEDDEDVDEDNPVVCFLRADSEAALEGTGLDDDDLTWEAEECEDGEDDCDVPEWMPVLEPVTSPAPNYSVLGYQKAEVIWDADDPRINPGPPEGGDELPVIEKAEWDAEGERGKARRGELEVEGSAAPNDRVAILNGVTGDRLFSVRADRDDGDFEVERRLHVKRVPCTVKAQVGDLVSQAVPVENAPENCIGQP
jgi:hypothetical protein